ncbi:MAG: homocysteine biosynthesis protein [Candidatus Omnitrophota bacterium]|nr:MAG: homocysteine biosynthesis protein [Candidatus Omnitrophota bacterium]
MRTIQEINEKIKSGKVVVLTAEEVIDLVEKKGANEAFNEVDVVTTATFGPMCSSAAYFNIGHSKPRIKLGGGKATLNGIPCHAGLAAVDLFLGANALAEDDPRNSVYPGEFQYGGGHLIQDLVSGKNIVLEANAYGTDCYPRKYLKTYLNINDINEAVLFNIRNCYQNYNVAVNTSDRLIYTYMGILRPKLGNANYCSAGSLSPLLNDPFYKTIGIGTKIFLGGATGFISWWGTQHNPCVERTKKGLPKYPAGTLALIGDLKNMSVEWLIGTSMVGYGVTLSVGVGVPIPILNEEILSYTAVKDEDIVAPIVDYSCDYPQRENKVLGFVDYAQLKSGEIELNGKKIPTGSLSSIRKAREIADTLKDWIQKGKFTLTEAAERIPSSDSSYKFKPLKEKKVENEKD